MVGSSVKLETRESIEEMQLSFFPAVPQDARHGLFIGDLLTKGLLTISFCAKQTASFLCFISKNI